MATKSFFGDGDDEYFDASGNPKRPGIYEFRRYDGRKIIYTLDFIERENEGEDKVAEEAVAPKLKVVKANRFEDFPNPPHALKSLDGEWLRFLGERSPEA
jgi:hypothetical protein